MSRPKLLDEDNWRRVTRELRPSFQRLLTEATDSPKFRLAACRLAIQVMDECDDPDPRATKAIVAAERYALGELPWEALLPHRQAAEDAAYQAIEKEQRMDLDSDDITVRVAVFQAQAKARACTCALACTLTSGVAALAYTTDEARSGLGCRDMIKGELLLENTYAQLRL